MTKKLMTRIVNLTPHPLIIADANDESIASLIIPSSGIARCTQTDTIIGERRVQNGSTTMDIPIVETTFGDVVDLPAPQDGVAYVVSSITAQACRARDDVYVPARPLRDSQGMIIACTALGRLPS